VCLASIVTPSSSSAACDFDGAQKASSMKFPLVRSYAQCQSPNTYYATHSPVFSMPACSTVSPDASSGGATPYEFNSHGGCKAKLTSKVVPDCSTVDDSSWGAPLGLPEGPCHITSISVECSGIERDGIPIDWSEDDGWFLRVKLRLTVDDPDAGSVTVQDPPYPINAGPITSGEEDLHLRFNAPEDGSLTLKSTTAEISALEDRGVAALPTCINAQILGLQMLDPDGLPFATMGFSTMVSGN
jgi:hypothetical protein